MRTVPAPTAVEAAAAAAPAAGGAPQRVRRIQHSARHTSRTTSSPTHTLRQLLVQQHGPKAARWIELAVRDSRGDRLALLRAPAACAPSRRQMRPDTSTGVQLL